MIFRPALCGASLLCPQKQYLSGKTDGLSGRTNQRLPPDEGKVASNLLPTKSGEGERVTIKLVQIQSYAGSFRHASRATFLPEEGYVAARQYT